MPVFKETTLKVSFVCFFLMTGYKLFSLYYPLFLAKKGFSLPEVGWNFFLIYLPIAIFQPLVAFFSHKTKPSNFLLFGILGYAIYSFSMIFLEKKYLFYFFQIFLGISAALFWGSSRIILMKKHFKKPTREFVWFYSSPIYAEGFAPALGAFLIWKFNFEGVFWVSFFLILFTFFLSFFLFKKERFEKEKMDFKKAIKTWQVIFEKIKKKEIFKFLIFSFLIITIGGIYHPFFVLFLKNLGFSQNQILIFVSISSFLYLPLFLFFIKKIERKTPSRNIIFGGRLCGVFSFLLGLFFYLSFLNFLSLLSFSLFEGTGRVIAGAGRSGLLSKIFEKIPEESGAFDTLFAPLGVGLGSFLGGVLISYLTFAQIFILGGSFVLFFSFMIKDTK